MKDFILLLSPYAPHLAEELWEKLGNKESVSKAVWPEYDENLCKNEEDTIIIQVNGKLRGEFKAPPGTNQETLKEMAMQVPKIKEMLATQKVTKIISLPGRLVNFVIK
jgi:leucyl-tRNA synthetase